MKYKGNSGILVFMFDHIRNELEAYAKETVIVLITNSTKRHILLTEKSARPKYGWHSILAVVKHAALDIWNEFILFVGIPYCIKLLKIQTLQKAILRILLWKHLVHI